MYGNSFLHMTVYVNFQVVMEIYNPLGQVTDAWVRLPVNGTIYDVFSPTGDTIPYQVIDEAYVTTYFTGWCHFHTGNITIVLSWKNARGIRGIKIRSLFVRPESNT